MGADPRTVDAEGRTAMHYAVSNDTARCLRVLLEHSESVINARDARGRAALHLAISAEVLFPKHGVFRNRHSRRWKSQSPCWAAWRVMSTAPTLA